MLSRREASAICLPAFTAPVVTCVALGSTRLFPLVTGVAYVAAFCMGAPLFAYLRHRGCSLAWRSMASAATAGVLAAALLLGFVFLAFPPQNFLANPEPALVLIATGVGWGFGLGLVAGVSLFTLLRGRVAASLAA
jgi:hypothetical protein